MIDEKNVNTVIERLFRIPTSKREIISIIFLLFLLFIFFFIRTQIFDDTNQNEMAIIIEKLNASEIEYLEVYRLVGRNSEKKLIKIIDSNDQIIKFTDSLKDISDWMPNHPVAEQSFILNIHKSSKEVISFNVVILNANSEKIYIYVKSKTTFTFQSKAFLQWLKQEEIVSSD